jgi:hypothetical protein
MNEVIAKEHLSVARNLKVMDRLSEAWIAEEGVKEMIFAITKISKSALPLYLKNDCEDHIIAACRICFEEGAYRGYCANVDDKIAAAEARAERAETENLKLKRFALRAYRVGEWIAGEGFVRGLTEESEDPDDLFIDLARFLSVETDEVAHAALKKQGGE